MGSEIQRFKNRCISLPIWNAITSKRCKIGDKLVLITNRESYDTGYAPAGGLYSTFWSNSSKYFSLGFDWYQDWWPWMTLNGEMALILPYFTEFGNFRCVLRKSGWQSHNYGQFTITMSSSKGLQRDRATPTV